MGGGFKRTPNAAGRTGQPGGRGDFDGVGSRSQVAEAVQSACIGRSRGEHYPVAINQPNDDVRNAGFTRIPEAVVVGVQPHRIAHRQGRVQPEVLRQVRGAVLAGVQCGPWNSERERPGFDRAVRLGRALVDAVRGVLRGRFKRTAGAARRTDQPWRCGDLHTVITGGEIAEAVRAVGPRCCCRNHVPGAVQQHHGHAADARFTDIPNAVVVIVAPDQIPDGERFVEAEVLVAVTTVVRHAGIERRRGSRSIGVVEWGQSDLYVQDWPAHGQPTGLRGAVVPVVGGIGGGQDWLERACYRTVRPGAGFESGRDHDFDLITARRQIREQVPAVGSGGRRDRHATRTEHGVADAVE